MRFEHLFQLNFSWLKYNIIYTCFVMNKLELVKPLVLSCNPRKHLYTVPIMEILLLFHSNRSFSLIKSDLCWPHSFHNKRRSHRLKSSLHPTSRLCRGSNWRPVVLSDRRRSGRHKGGDLSPSSPIFFFLKGLMQGHETLSWLACTQSTQRPRADLGSVWVRLFS